MSIFRLAAKEHQSELRMCAQKNARRSSRVRKRCPAMIPLMWNSTASVPSIIFRRFLLASSVFANAWPRFTFCKAGGRTIPILGPLICFIGDRDFCLGGLFVQRCSGYIFTVRRMRIRHQQCLSSPLPFRKEFVASRRRVKHFVSLILGILGILPHAPTRSQ